MEKPKLGSKGSQTTSQTQTYTPSPAINQAGNTALSMATSAAQQPFNLPVAPVAGFSPFQQQAFNQYQNLQGMAQPYYNQAQNYIQGSAAPITGSDVNQYYNPYASSVLANLQETQGQQMQDLTGRSTQTAGGVGADRIGVAQGELARQQNLATGQTMSGIYQNALNAAQQNKQMQANAGYGMANLGTTAQGAALQGTGALYGAGQQQQALQQAQLNAPYQNQLAQLAYPFQTAQYLAGITGNLAGPLGGTTSGFGQSTPPQPSMFSQILGAGTAAAGAYGAFGGGSANGFTFPGTSQTSDALNDWSQDSAMGMGAPVSAYFSNRGGRIGYAGGGSAGSGFENPSWMNADPIVPQIEMHPTSGQSHNNLNLSSGQQGSSGPGAGEIIGDVAKIATMFLSQGGAVDPRMGVQAFADGGNPFDNRFDDAATMGEMPLGMAQNHYLSGPDAYRIGPQSPTTPVPALANPQASAPPPDTSNMPVFGPDGTMMGNMMSNQGQAPTQNLSDQGAMQPAAMGAPGNRGAMAPPPPAPSQPPPSTNYRSLDDKLPYPDLDAVHDTSRELAKSPWTALMNAGFAMMAGTSPWAGVNIGKGLLAGTKTLEDQRKELATEEGVNQRAKQLIQQAEFHRDQYEKMNPFQKEEIRLKEQQIQLQAQLLGVRGWTPVSENPVDGSKTLYNKMTGETRIVHADGTVENGSLTDPGKASTNPNTPTSDNTPSGNSTPVEASPLREPQLASNLVPPKVDTSYFRKGSPALTQANAENTKVTAAHAMEAKNLGNEDMLVQQTKQQYGVLMKDADSDGFLTKLATMRGNNIDERIRYARAANEAARAAGKPPLINPEKLAAMEVISKDQRTLGMLFASNLSSREAFAGQQVGIESTPGLTQSPLGMLRLLSGYDAQLQYTRDKHAFYENYIKKNNGVPTGWEQAFQKQNPVDRYMVRSMMENLPNRQAAEKLPEAVKILKEHPNDPQVVAGFNKHYGNTASYWLTGHLDMLGAQ